MRLTIPLLVGILVLFLAPPALAAPPPVRLTAAETPDVSVLIDTITPLSPGPKDTVRITGRVVDHSAHGLTAVQVSLHMGEALSSRSQLHALRTAPVPQDLAYYQPTLGDGKLSTGHSLSFTIARKISELPIPSAGVYPMQVTATGVRQGDGRPSDLATASTFLPYIPATPAAAVTPLAWLIPLTADPTLLADGDFTGDAVTTAVADGGRLKRLLDALGSASAASVTLDPALIRTLSLAANGRYVVAVPGKTTGRLEPANAASKNWLDELRASANLSVIPLPYDNVDVEALVHNGGSSLADSARSRGDDVLKLGLLHTTTSLTSNIAAPPDGLVDAAGAKYYATTANADALVLSPDAVPSTGDNPSASAKSPSTSTQLLLSDDVLNRLVTTGVPAGSTPRLAEQEVIAELAEAHVEDGFTTTPGKAASTAPPLLIEPPDGWNPSAAWLSRLLTDTTHLPWIKQTSVGSLLDAPTEPRAALQYPPATRAAEIPSYLVQSSLGITTSTQGLFSDPQPAGAAEPQSPDSILQPIRDAALAAVSSRWRNDPTQAFPFRNSGEVALTSLAQQVKVVSSPQVTLTSRSGKVPVTIENDLGAAVDVSLVLSSLDRSRVSSDTVVTRNVRAGQKVQVEVEVKAASAGTFPVRLTLYTSDGRPLGTPVQVLVRSTRYGVVATIFTIVALSILGLAVLFRAIRGLIRRSRRPQQAPRRPASNP
ncbi:MAG TPA: DUF6049 family protein [Frankiaceae bacterium]|nr:DUF6049 family protein [Frankiaceae bacterium]